MQATPWGGSGDKSDPELPAVNVNWDEVTEFCRKLTDRERVAGKLQANEEYRLPTEGEWEYACRSGTTTAYSFGDDESRLGDFAWFRGNSANKLYPVGTKKPNAWGLSDMHGNVWEWCADWYDGKLAGGVDPVGPAGGSFRVLRGGDWSDSPVLCRSAYRNHYVPSSRLINLGFRIACSVKGQAFQPAITAPTPVSSNQAPAANGLQTPAAQPAADQASKLSRLMPLSSISTLSEGDAELLVQQNIASLDLDGLADLSADVARILARKRGGRLSLDGLKELRPEVAAALAEYRGQLFLGGLATVSAETGMAMGPFVCHLYLDGVTELSGTAAEAIGWRGWLTLKSLPQLSSPAARGLAKRRGNINLRNVATLSDEAAAELARHEGWLILDGLQELSTAAARSLVEHKGPIDLDGIKTLSDETAAALAKAQGRIRLNGLQSLSQDATAALRANPQIVWSVNGLPSGIGQP